MIRPFFILAACSSLSARTSVNTVGENFHINGKWNTERNVSEFIAAKPEWKAHGLLAVTVNFQGGSPEGYSKTQPWINSSFEPNGCLRPAFTAMVRQTRAVPGYKTMPILFYEDDHENFDQTQNNFASAVAEHVSKGWFDYRRKGEALGEGYQSRL
jgi:hypothetical protein